MSMLSLTGQVINVFQVPEGTNKEGEKYGGQDRVQIMAENVLRNGETRVDLIDLTVENAKAYTDLKGKRVCVPVGAFCSKNAVQFYIPKGSVPSLDSPLPMEQ